MEKIKVETVVHADIAKVWDAWTTPEAVVQWNAASEDWHTVRAENDVSLGGRFSCRMEAKDGSEGFDFEGTYTEVVPQQRIAYVMDDGREVVVTFTEEEDGFVHVVEEFDPETQNSEELQRAGWQAILDNFKRYVEKPEA